MFESHERNDATYPAAQSEGGSGERNIGQHLRVLLRRKWQFLISAGLIFGTAMVVICTLPSRYEASAVIHFGQGADQASDESAFVRRLLGRKGSVAMQAELITEPRALEAAARKVALAGWPTVGAKQILECVRLEGEASGVKVCAEAADPKLAAEVANAVSRVFVDFSDRRRRLEMQESIDLHKAVIAEQVPVIQAKGKEIEQWELENGLPRQSDPLEKINLHVRRLRNRQGEVDNKVLTLKAERQALVAMALGKVSDAAYDSLGNDSEIVRLRRSVSDLQQQKSEMAMAFKPGHPQMKLIDMRIARTRRDLVQQQQRVIGAKLVAIDQDAVSLKKQAVELAKLETIATKQRNEIASAVLKRKALLEDLTKAKRLHEKRLVRLHDAEYGLKTMPKTAKVISAAAPRWEAVYPPRLWYSVIAAGFSVLFGVVLAFSLEHIDRSIKSASQAEAVLRSPVVGMIPRLSGAGAKNFVGRCRNSDQNPQSIGAEAYRLIRSSLLFGLKDSQTRTILVTSALPGEGKTTTASNLAISLAAAGKRVCLVEADLRQPRLCYVFQTADAPGLSDVLAGRCDRRDAMRSSGVENLDLLVAGPVPANPAEMLESTRFSRLLDELAGAYDHVIIDAPPVLAVTDAQVVAARADQTLLVVEAHRYNRCNGQRAVQRLSRVHASVAGIILNNVRVKDGEYESQHVAYQKYAMV